MEVNREEAIRCLSIAQKHRNASNYPSALKFAKKSISLYSTPEGEKMVEIIEQDISLSATSESPSAGASGTSTPTPSDTAPAGSTTPSGSSTRGKASGVEEHVTSAHQRPGHASSSTGAGPSRPAAAAKDEKPKKREYTVKQLEVVKRVKSCKGHQYYEILAVEKSCTENDVKKAYKKLALALHPDKNGAPGADEAFKMVSKAFQVLSDGNLRAAFDSNPNHDPTQRGGGGGGGGFSRGGGMQPGFGGGNGMYTEVNPEDIFNAFFGGGNANGSPFGGANVFTFGGPGGFSTSFGGPGVRRRPARPGAAGNDASPLVALLPVILLCAFALLSLIPAIFSTNTPEPSYAFEASTQHDLGRETWNWRVPYYVNKAEWEGSAMAASIPENKRAEERPAMYSTKVRGFERGIEGVYAQKLRNECEYFHNIIDRQISQEAGIFGIGADYEKIRQLRAKRSPACEQLKAWGIQRSQGGGYY